MNKNNKIINIIIMGVFMLLLLIHVADLVYLYGVFLVINEVIINSFIILLRYLLLFIRASGPYVVIYIGLKLFSVIYYEKKNVKIFGIDLKKHKSKTAYLNFYLKEYIYVIILFIHIGFIIVIYNFELYYNNVIIISIVSLYLFIGLSIYIKQYLIKNNIAGKKMFNLGVNATLLLAIGAFISTIAESINEHINLKIDLSDYLYSAIQHNDRLLLKFRHNPKNHGLKIYNEFKNHKANLNYIYLKQQVLNNNVLNDLSYNKPKLYYNKISINHDNLNIYKLTKASVKSLNNAHNSLCANNYNVGYDIHKNKDLFKKLNNINLIKDSANGKANLNHLYDYNGSDYMSTKSKLDNLPDVFNNVFKNKDINIKNLLLPKEFKYELLKDKLSSTYKMDKMDIKKIKVKYMNYDSYKLLGFKTIYGDNNKYNNLYNNFLVGGEINNVEPLQPEPLDEYSFMRKYDGENEIEDFENYNFYIKTLTKTIDIKNLYLKYYKPYAKYPQYISKLNYIRNSKRYVFGLDKYNMTVKKFKNYKNYDIVFREKAEKKGLGRIHDVIEPSLKYDKGGGPLIKYTCIILDGLGFNNRQYRDYKYSNKEFDTLLFYNQDKIIEMKENKYNKGLSTEAYIDFIMDSNKFSKLGNIYNFQTGKKNIGFLSGKYNQFKLGYNRIYQNTGIRKYINGIVDFLEKKPYYEKDFKVLIDFIMSVAKNKITDERALANFELSLNKVLSTKEGANEIFQLCYNNLDFEFSKLLKILNHNQVNYKFNKFNNIKNSSDLDSSVYGTEYKKSMPFDKESEYEYETGLNRIIIVDIAYDYAYFLANPELENYSGMESEIKYKTLKKNLPKYIAHMTNFLHEELETLMKEESNIKRNIAVDRANKQSVYDDGKTEAEDFISEGFEEQKLFIKHGIKSPEDLLNHYQCDPDLEPEEAAIIMSHYDMIMDLNFVEVYKVLQLHYTILSSKQFLETFQTYLMLNKEYIKVLFLLVQELENYDAKLTKQIKFDLINNHNHYNIFIIKNQINVLKGGVKENNKLSEQNINELENIIKENILDPQGNKELEALIQESRKKPETEAERLNNNLAKYLINKDGNAYNNDRYKNYDQNYGVKSFEDLKKKWLK